MSYGELKIDTITFTAGGVDASVSVSGLVQNPTFTGNITTTGTISGDIIKGNTISGVNVIGTTEISGATVTGDVGLFGTITGGVHTLTSGVFASGTAANPSITFVDDLDTGLFTGAANTVSLAANGAAVLTVSGTNVGIGTESPSATLSVSNGGAEGVEIFPNESGATVLQSYDRSGSSWIEQRYRASVHRFDISGASEKMRIDSSGRLLVGTTSSLGNDHQFQVRNDSGGTGQLFTSVASTVGPYLGFNKSRGTAASPAVVQQDDQLGTVEFFGYSAAASAYRLGANIAAFVDGTPDSGGDTTDMPGRLVFSTCADGASSPTERMTIDSSGNVGIGTTNPAYKLDLVGTTTSAVRIRSSSGASRGLEFWNNSTDDEAYISNYYVGPLIFQTDNSEKVRIDGAGNVGIGTTSPGAKLHIEDSGANAAKVRIGFDSTRYYDIYRESSGGTGLLYFYGSQTSYNGFVFDTVDGERARIDSSGRLLVGTSTSSSADSYIQSVRTSGQSNALVESKELADSQITSYIASARRSGGSFRYSELGLFKHSGITETCSYLRLQSTDGAANYFWTDDSDQFRISTNAAHIGTTSGTVVGTQTSDERIKNILGSVDYGLDTIKQIEPVRFALKSDPDTEKLGFIAQQVQPLIPQSVFDTGEHIEGEPEDAPTKLGMEYVALIPVLVNAIKELSAEVDALKAQLS